MSQPDQYPTKKDFYGMSYSYPSFPSINLLPMSSGLNKNASSAVDSLNIFSWILSVSRVSRVPDSRRRRATI